MNSIKNIVIVSLRNLRGPYIITGSIIALAITGIILTLVMQNGSSDLSFGNYFYLLPLCVAISIPKQLNSLVSLGTSRTDFFKSAIITYTIVTFIVTFFALLSLHTIDRLLLNLSVHRQIMDVGTDGFRFAKNGVIIYFFQMSAFMLLFSCMIHTLTLLHNSWHGFVADALIIAIISVFTPIAPLRASLRWFFNMIIFHDYAIVQILSCIILGTVVYCAGLLLMKRRTI